MKGGSQDIGMLVLRLGLGSIMWVHGAQKLLGWFGGHGPQGFVGWVQSLGFPAPFGWLVILIEFCGGLGVLLGVLARLSSLGIAACMLVAVFVVHRPGGFFMNWGGAAGRGEGWEYSFALLAASLAVAIAGPGKYSAFDRT